MVVGQDCTLEFFQGNFNPGTGEVEIWCRPGSYLGFESSNTGWTKAGTANVTFALTLPIIRVVSPILDASGNINMPLSVPPGTSGLNVWMQGYDFASGGISSGVNFVIG